MSETSAGTRSDAWTFDGIRVIGDVHGEAQAFRSAIEQARAKNLFVVALGDLVDRGPDSVGALRLGLELLDRGTGLFLRSNHDDKLRRALLGNPITVGPDLKRTLDAIAAEPDRSFFVARVREALHTAPWWLRAGDRLLVHGGFHPAMLSAPGPEAVSSREAAEACRRLAIYGEVDKRAAGRGEPPARTYRWLDTVPAGVTVVIGHDVVSTEEIVERRGALGGRLLFCDTGCGRGGPLSFLDLPGADLRSPPRSRGSDA
ncbi:MAG: metallophosphoesterase [Xanthobacteraceae bacterium]